MMTNEEIERLALLIEECGEVQHMAGKILRHGYESTHEDYDNVSNRELLYREILDLHIAIELMYQKSDINREDVKDLWKSRIDRKNQYLKHNIINNE